MSNYLRKEESRSPMLKAERLDRTLKLLEKNRVITVDELVDTLNISEATARRDLELLAKKKLLIRTRGGAISIDSNNALTAKITSSVADTNVEAKKHIGNHALQFVRPGCTIGLTGGSTIRLFAEQLADWADEQLGSDTILTAVTNSIETASRLARSTRIKVLLTGGELNGRSFELTGPFASHVLNQLALDLSFIGVNGIDTNGPGTTDEYEAIVNRLMVERSLTSYILADHTKFGKRSFSVLRTTGKSPHIITDSPVEASLAQALQTMDYEILQAAEVAYE
ncbi:MAG: DeoR/GlpR family DNA-binding transcription regulator [Corynebacterium sp.]|nr:DeoR/GlpR family DNA-binding transcription regulator [Corynebacterium sp.]